MDYCVFGSKLQFPKAPASAAMVIISLPGLAQSFFLFINFLETAHDCTSPAHNEVETKHLLWFLSSVLHHHHHTMCALLKSSSSCCFSQHYCEKSHLESDKTTQYCCNKTVWEALLTISTNKHFNSLRITCCCCCGLDTMIFYGKRLRSCDGDVKLSDAGDLSDWNNRQFASIVLFFTGRL